MDWKRWALGLLCCCGLYFLFLFGLTRAGMIGPDEPRYAAIGQAMARSGDWITPHLWGSVWFEKPALLYWMTALGFKAGLGLDLAPRLPVALASVAFLVFFFVVIRREYGERAACYGSVILATSAGWVAFSHAAVTDLPLTVTFGAAMLLVPRVESEPEKSRTAILGGILLGLAVLAKGLVPLILFLPALWFLRHCWRQLLVLFAATAVVAGPWYGLVIFRNGHAFVEEFFWKQHFARFFSGALLHEKPFWYYGPVTLAGFFPWIPMLGLLVRKRLYEDRRVWFLLAWSGWVLLFFSASSGKLPGYILPLFPAVAALLGIALANLPERSWMLAALFGGCALLLGFVPIIQELLPRALLSGVSRAQVHIGQFWLLPAVLLAVACVALEWKGYRTPVMALIALAVVLSAIRMVWQVYPVLDRLVSPRAFWASESNPITCVPLPDRSWRYGLDYYVGQDLPDCN